MLLYCLVTVLFCTPIYGGVLQNLPKNWHKNERIVDGVEIDITEVPYQAAILYKGPTTYQIGAGAIIKSNIVVTSGFVTYLMAPNPQWAVRVGSTYGNVGGQVFDPLKLIVHPNYNISNNDYDICLFVLSSNIIIDDVTTRIISLPPQDAPILDYTFGKITGWGFIGRDENNTELYAASLQKIILPVITYDICIERYPPNFFISPRMFCVGNFQTGGETPCYRDYGSPFIMNDLLYGIYSWGSCDWLSNPSVMVRIPALRNWIDEQMRIN